MGYKGNREWAKELQEAIKQAVDDPDDEPTRRPTSWFSTWVAPVPRRERFRRWLSRWLKSALRDVPCEVSARYFEEMADDIRELDAAQAVDRFIDKVAPELLPNELRDEHD